MSRREASSAASAGYVTGAPMLADTLFLGPDLSSCTGRSMSDRVFARLQTDVASDAMFGARPSPDRIGRSARGTTGSRDRASRYKRARGHRSNGGSECDMNALMRSY